MEHLQSPLSSAQKRLWIINKFNPNITSYNVHMGLEIKGPLDEVALTESLNNMVQRHDILRAVFYEENGLALQKIMDYSPFSLKTINLISLNSEESKEEALAFGKRLANTIFDLSKGPLYKFLLLRVTPTSHYFFLVFSHFICDGVSIDIFMKEVFLLYNAYAKKIQNVVLASLNANYFQYVKDEQNSLESEEIQKKLSYWEHLLHSPNQDISLRTTHKRPLKQTFKGSNFTYRFPTELVKGVKSRSIELSCTPFVYFLAAFNVLLYRYTGDKDLIVGTPTSQRQKLEFEHLIGLFVNPVALRTKLSTDSSFEKLVHQVKKTLFDAYENSSVPFEKVVEQLHLDRDLSRNPLFQINIGWQTSPFAKEYQIQGVDIQLLKQDLGVSRFDLEVNLFDDGQGVEALVFFSSDLYSSQTIKQIMHDYESLLEEATKNPWEKLNNLSLKSSKTDTLPAREDDKNPEPKQTVLSLFKLQVEKQPNEIALRIDDGELSFTALDKKSNQIAEMLKNKGIKDDSFVGICFKNSLDLIASILGVLKAQCTFVPIDPNWPLEKKKQILCQNPISLSLSSSEFSDDLKKLGVNFSTVEMNHLKDYKGLSQLEDVNLKKLAYVLFTSGSTGIPKGVMVDHKALANYANWTISNYIRGKEEFKEIPLFTSVCFDLTLTTIFGALCSGLCLKILAHADFIDHFQQLFTKQSYTFIKLTPSHLRIYRPFLELNHTIMPSTIIVGGEQLYAEDLTPWLEKNDRFEFINEYGPTESTVGCTIYRVSATNCPKEGPIPIGLPLKNMEVHLLNQDLLPVPFGAVGEIYIGGMGNARGYLQDPSLTSQKFIPYLMEKVPGARLFKTGDLAHYLDSGNLEYLGRKDDQIKIAGRRIEIGEIESIILSALRCDQVCIIAEEKDRKKSLICFIAPEQRFKSQEEMKEFLSDYMPEYMIPKVFYFLERLNVNQNGKVNRETLLKIASQASPPTNEPINQEMTKKEEILYEIWCECLKRPSVGVHENFFLSGGDSISAMQVISKAKLKGLNISPKQLLELKTIHKLAKSIDHTETKPTEIHQEQSLHLLPAQRRFFNDQHANYSHYNHAVLLKTGICFQPHELKNAWKTIMENNDAFHLTFSLHEGKWNQKNQKKISEAFFHYRSLKNLSSEEKNNSISDNVKNFQESLDISKGDLCRLVFFDLGKTNESLILIIIHHLIVDGVSWRILLQTLEKLLLHGEGTQPSIVGETKGNLFKWSEVLNRHSQKEPQTFKNTINSLNLVDWNRCFSFRNSLDLSINSNFEEFTKEHKLIYDKELTSSIISSSKDIMRLEEFLMINFKRSFHEFTDRPIHIEIENHGRVDQFENIDISSTIGWFTTFYPLLLFFSDSTDINQCLQELRLQLGENRTERFFEYTLMKHGGNPKLSKLLPFLPPTDISFNFLGNLDGSAEHFTLLENYINNSVNPSSPRRFFLDFVAYLHQDSLHISWSYSSKVFTKDFIQNLAQSFQNSSLLLIKMLREDYVKPSSISN